MGSRFPDMAPPLVDSRGLRQVPVSLLPTLRSALPTFRASKCTHCLQLSDSYAESSKTAAWFSNLPPPRHRYGTSHEKGPQHDQDDWGKRGAEPSHGTDTATWPHPNIGKNPPPLYNNAAPLPPSPGSPNQWRRGGKGDWREGPPIFQPTIHSQPPNPTVELNGSPGPAWKSAAEANCGTLAQVAVQ